MFFMSKKRSNAGDAFFGRVIKRDVRLKAHKLCLKAIIFAGLLIGVSVFSVTYFFGKTNATGTCETHTLTLYTESGEGTIALKDSSGVLVGEETVMVSKLNLAKTISSLLALLVRSSSQYHPSTA